MHVLVPIRSSIIHSRTQMMKCHGCRFGRRHHLLLEFDYYFYCYYYYWMLVPILDIDCRACRPQPIHNSCFRNERPNREDGHGYHLRSGIFSHASIQQTTTKKKYPAVTPRIHCFRFHRYHHSQTTYPAKWWPCTLPRDDPDDFGADVGARHLPFWGCRSYDRCSLPHRYSSWQSPTSSPSYNRQQRPCRRMLTAEWWESMTWFEVVLHNNELSKRQRSQRPYPLAVTRRSHARQWHPRSWRKTSRTKAFGVSSMLTAESIHPYLCCPNQRYQMR